MESAAKLSEWYHKRIVLRDIKIINEVLCPIELK